MEKKHKQFVKLLQSVKIKKKKENFTQTTTPNFSE